MTDFNLTQYGISVANILRNPFPEELYRLGLEREKGTRIADNKALVALSGEKTGRSPTDKRLVKNPESSGDIWWGSVNIPLSSASFEENRGCAIEYLNQQEQLYCIDAFGGWDPAYQIKVRVICARAYHALFMHNMLIRPKKSEMEQFGEPDYVIFNGGGEVATTQVEGVTSTTSVCLNLERGEFVILGTEYAGEMKKGVFTVMNYIMPQRDVLSMHCSANSSKTGEVSLFFGLSGTGKTTLSADPNRGLIGDDEHCWSDEGVFNIEGGCYAKVIDLSEEAEPQIYNAIRFGSVLENVVLDPETQAVDYHNTSITQNTRGSYPIEYIDNAVIPCVGSHPTNVILLTCDAFGVLPPVSKLTSAQAMYHFISGYTAKVAGTEVGVTEPEATFSACFGAPFLVWHPTKYAEMLAQKIESHEANTWLINTGWTGGSFGVGSRIKLAYTRAIIDALHSGELAGVEIEVDPVFGLAMPKRCTGVPGDLLNPRNTWSDKGTYDLMAKRLLALFQENFSTYADQASEAILGAAPGQ
jgi:phosphoenolpyruvate carboxykinase (ATP)